MKEFYSESSAPVRSGIMKRICAIKSHGILHCGRTVAVSWTEKRSETCE